MYNPTWVNEQMSQNIPMDVPQPVAELLANMTQGIAGMFALAAGHYGERSICDLTVWDPSEAECESFVGFHACSDTYGSLCPG